MSAVRRRIPNDIPAFGLLRGVGIDARPWGTQDGFSPLAIRALLNEDRTVAGSQ